MIRTSTFDLFVEAAKRGNLKLLKSLLLIPEVVANITARGNWAFRSAVYNEHLGVVKLLLNYPQVVNRTAFNNGVLLWAVHYGRTEAVKLIEEACYGNKR